MKDKVSIPSKFELLNDNEVHNTNFKKVKLYIQSDGVNYNGSSFTVESMQDAMNTIDYIPILGYIKEVDGVYDFDGHNIAYDIHVDSKGETTILENFEEIPIGVVTSDGCHIEYVNDKNFLVAYGYIWSSYSNRGISILERDMEKEVSMEICVFNGEFDEEGIFAISKYEIQGVTVLGKDVPAAIEGSKIQMSFSKNTEYEDNLKEIDKLLKAFALKGGEEVEENKIEQPQEELEFQEEVVEELAQSVENEQIVYEEEEEKEEICPECNKPIEECVCEEEEKEEEFSQEEVVEEIEEVEEKLYSQSELDTIVSNVRDEYSQLVEELESLREFKNEYDRQVKLQELEQSMNELASNFNVENDVLKELKEKVVNGEYSMDKFELELYRHNSPVKKEFNKKESNKLPVIDNKNKMSDVDLFFDRYNVPKRK